jgi:pimeloyl-ACP methyl ester carboxylesterase
MATDDGATVIRHRTVELPGAVRLHLAETGPVDGPPVILLHGFPECWYSWRHQLRALGAAGWHAIAPDQRGYGRSSAPEEIEDYALPALAGDVVALIAECGNTSGRKPVLVGHDWGAPVAWVTAMLRPELLAGMQPPSVTRRQYGEGFYQIYFQEPGRADAELAANPDLTFRSLLFAASGDNPRNDPPSVWVIPEGFHLSDGLAAPEKLPDWLTEEDIAVFVREYAQQGDRAFTGPLNWYRNIERNNKLLALFRGRTIPLPALFVGGDRDLVMAFRGMDRLPELLKHTLPRLRGSHILPGCGHWTQQERPEEVNALLLEFLRGLED